MEQSDWYMVSKTQEYHAFISSKTGQHHTAHFLMRKNVGAVQDMKMLKMYNKKKKKNTTKQHDFPRKPSKKLKVKRIAIVKLHS